MDGSAIICALISGASEIIAAIIGGKQNIYHHFGEKEKPMEQEEAPKLSDNTKNSNDIDEKPGNPSVVPIPPISPEYPKFLNPDQYDIDKEDYVLALGGLLEKRRREKVSIKKLKNTDDRKADDRNE